MMTDIAPLGFAIDTQPLDAAAGKAQKVARDFLDVGAAADAMGAKASKGAREVASEQDKMIRKAEELKRVVDAGSVAQARQNKLLEEHNALLKAGLITQQEYDAARRMAAPPPAMPGNQRNSFGYTRAGASRMLGMTAMYTASDVTSQLAFGTNPAMIAMQQGPQVLQAMAQAGVGRMAWAGIGAVGAVGAGIGLIAYLEKVNDEFRKLERTTAMVVDGLPRAREAIGLAADAAGLTGSGRNNLLAAATGIVNQPLGRALGGVGGATEFASLIDQLNVAGYGDRKALPQLTQMAAKALGDGGVDAGELEALMTKLPFLATALQEGLGKSRAEVEAMARSGQLTAGAFISAIEASRQLEDAARKNASEWGKVGDSFKGLLESLSVSTGFKSFSKSFARSLAEGFDEFRASLDQHEETKRTGQTAYQRRLNMYNPNVDTGQVDTTLYDGNPLAGRMRLTSGPGRRRDPITGQWREHAGWDYAAEVGTPLHATRDGRIVFAGERGGYGNTIELIGQDGRGDRFAHLSRFNVQSGAEVRKGDIIGYTGNSGRSTGPHLHWEQFRRDPTNALRGQAALGTSRTGEIARLEADIAQDRAAANDPNTPPEERAALLDRVRQNESRLRSARASLAYPDESPFDRQRRTQAYQTGEGGARGINAEAWGLLDSQQRGGWEGDFNTARSIVLQGRLSGADASIWGMNRGAGRTASMAAAAAGGPWALRNARINAQVEEYRDSQFGGLTSPDIEAAVDRYRKALVAATEAQEKLTEAQRKEALDWANEGATGRLGVGGGNGVLRFDRQRMVAELLRSNPNADTSGLLRSFRLADLGQAAGMARGYADEAVDLGDQLAMGGMSGSRGRVFGAGMAVRRQFQRGSELSDTQINQMVELAEAAEKARIAVEEYAEAHHEISSSISGGVGNAIRGVGSSLLRGDASLREVDRILADQLAGIGDRMIDNLIAKPMERMTEGFADRMSTWIIDRLGGMATVEVTSVKAATSVATLAVAAQAATAALSSMAASAGGSTATNIASSIVGALTGGVGTGVGGAAGMSYRPSGVGGVGMHVAAFGTTLSSGRHVRFAALGTVLDRATMVGQDTVGGEAGDEALLPLKRGPDGRLGVAAHGGGGGDVQVIVNDMRGKGGAPVETEASQGPDGKRIIKMTIRDEMRAGIAGGEYDSQMRERYGAQPAIARR